MKSKTIFFSVLALAISILACGGFSSEQNGGVQPTQPQGIEQQDTPASPANPAVAESPTSELPVSWKLDVVSVQTDHVDYIVYNISDTFKSIPLVGASIDGEVNNQIFTYSDISINPVQNEITSNPNYPDYQRWVVPQITNVPPGFYTGKFRITWTIPQTVKLKLLNLSLSESFGGESVLSTQIDLSNFTGSDTALPVLPQNSQSLKLGDAWSVGQQWEVTALNTRKLNLFGPASGIEIRIKNLGGYTASFKNDFSVLLFTKSSEILDVDFSFWQRFVIPNEVPNEIIFESFNSPFPGKWNYCEQIEPASECQGVIIFDSANARTNPVTGESKFMRDDVDPNASLLDYSGSLLVLRYRPTEEYKIFRISD